MHYLSTSKIAIAVTGNFAFAMALCLYHLLTAVRLLWGATCVTHPSYWQLVFPLAT